jgi:hypothetical protein
MPVSLAYWLMIVGHFTGSELKLNTNFSLEYLILLIEG